MRLSRASRYALHALSLMAKAGKDRPTSTKVLGEATGISNVYLLKALKPCVMAGIVSSITGPNGGYALRKDPDSVTILDIIQAVDGPMYAVDERLRAGSDDVDRALAALLEEATRRVKQVYDGMTLTQLAKKRK
jgi:Rrf2 family protein